jgi:hypothetical protein
MDHFDWDRPDFGGHIFTGASGSCLNAAEVEDERGYGS